MTTFNAYRINQVGEKIVADFAEIKLTDLTPGEVVIKVLWSGINFKDALAATGRGKILRQFPLNGGIDLAGVVTESAAAKFKAGDEVLVCGGGLSETIDGGYSQIARVPAAAAVPLPAGLNLREAMVLGTAGFTAAMAVARMEQNGQRPDMGAILVTGASGGVGSVAVNILRAKGYAVTAFTGGDRHHNFLRELGAAEFVDRNAIEMGSRPLEKGLWGGAVDNAGGDILAWLTRTVKPWGNIASVGLVRSHKLETTVMPFILRGVSLLGINSIDMPAAVREELWTRLGADLRPPKLDLLATRELEFSQLPEAFANYFDGENYGRTVVKIQD